jgi:hypothetical protein
MGKVLVVLWPSEKLSCAPRLAKKDGGTRHIEDDTAVLSYISMTAAG